MKRPTIRHTHSPILHRLYGSARVHRSALAEDPGMANVWAYEISIRQDPVRFNILDTNSEFYPIKALSSRIYSTLLSEVFRSAGGGTVIDLGCGVGRSTAMALPYFERVIAIESTRSALDLHERNLRAFDGIRQELHWETAAFLDTLKDANADLTMAIEYVCYCSNPEAVLLSMAGATRPGGRLVCSVEGWPGGPATVGGMEPWEVPNERLSRPGETTERYVRYFDANELRAACEQAGWTDVTVTGSHYFGEGPLWLCLDDERLTDPDYLAMAVEADAACGLNPILAPWARVFTAVGRKP